MYLNCKTYYSFRYGTFSTAGLVETAVNNGVTALALTNINTTCDLWEFVKLCRENGINIPIIPGLKPITNKKQLNILPKIFHVDIPTDLSNAITKAKTDEDVERIGTEWLIQQSKELREFGVPVLHYYTLGKPKVIYNVVKELV